RVALVVGRAAAPLHFAVLAQPAPRPGRGLVGPFGQRDHFTVLGNVALERDVAGLDAGQLEHPVCIGLIGAIVDVGTLAIAKHDKEHQRSLPKRASAMATARASAASAPSIFAPGKSTFNIACTCAFSAPPLPTTAFLTSLAACS